MEHLPSAPLTQTNNPDNFEVQSPTHHTPIYPTIPLDTCITRSHYTRAIHRVPSGKAPVTYAITSELLKHLPEKVHTLIYTLFFGMNKHSYTLNEWCRRVTCLV
jgi:hypothetical protein